MTEGGVEAVGVVELAFDLVGLLFQVGRLGRERRLVDGPGQVAVEQAVLHVGQLGASLGQPLFSLGLGGVHVVERARQRIAKPLAYPRRGQTARVELLDDRGLHIGLPPPYLRMAGVRVVVPAAVVDVRVAVAVAEPAANALAGDGVVTDPAAEHAPRKHNVRVSRAPVAAVEDVLASVEGTAVDQQPVAALEDLPVALQLADVEAIVKDVGQGRAVETRLAGPVGVAFVGELRRQPLKGVLTAGVQLEDSDDGLGLFRVRNDRLVTVVHVQVPEGRQPRGPALADLLIHALEDLSAEVVRVVLRDRRHHVERQCPGGAGAELVLDEG